MNYLFLLLLLSQFGNGSIGGRNGGCNGGGCGLNGNGCGCGGNSNGCGLNGNNCGCNGNNNDCGCNNYGYNSPSWQDDYGTCPCERNGNEGFPSFGASMRCNDNENS